MFQFITQPHGWCWGRCFCEVQFFCCRALCCLLLCIQDYKIGKPVYCPYEAHLFSSVFREEETRPQTPLSIQGQRHPYTAYKGSIQRRQPHTPRTTTPEPAVSNLPTVYLATHSRTRADRRERPCWECFRGLSAVCDLEEGVSHIAGEENPLQ